MRPQPLYDSAGVHPAFGLRYSWAAWPFSPPLLAQPDVLSEVEPFWENDGLRVLERCWSDDKLHLTISTKPDVSPVLLVGRAKGRLQHAIRKAAPDFAGFRRKVSLRSVGHNCREDVEAYIASQVDAVAFADPSFRALLKEFTVVRKEVDLAAPTESAHGRYWYNLHVVLVTAERYRVVDRGRLATLRDTALRIAEKKGHQISRLAVMPDHLHLSPRGNIADSPTQIALGFQNNLAYALGQVRFLADTFYVGTFGEYDMRAIRRHESPA